MILSRSKLSETDKNTDKNMDKNMDRNTERNTQRNTQRKAERSINIDTDISTIIGAYKYVNADINENIETNEVENNIHKKINTNRSISKRIKTNHTIKYYTAILFLMIISIPVIFVSTKAYAAEDKVYKEGIYCYAITDEEKKEVKLIGIESNENQKELGIPGTTIIENIEYRVSYFEINWNYYNNEKLKEFYNGVTKLKIADNFTGVIKNPVFAFGNLNTIEFSGKVTPEKVSVELSNSSSILDIIFIVPTGMESDYAHVIEETMGYYVYSDLYEKDIRMIPTIVTAETIAAGTMEMGCFSIDGLIYQVIDSAKEKPGKVQLIGITEVLHLSYLALPKEVKNGSYSYSLTSIGQNALVACGATVIVIPDTVTQMNSWIFDKKVELLFLSKNCKVIPRGMITDENNTSNLRFVYLPEGVTTITTGAFANDMVNATSIILPATISLVGKESLYEFTWISFLNEKPIENINSAVKKSSIIKVPRTAVSDYKLVLGSKITVKTVKDIVNATKLTLNKSSIKMTVFQKEELSVTMNKSSNETVYWLSSDSNILRVSKDGIITPKKEGTAYVIAYTRISGLHASVKVSVISKEIKQGIYTYQITDAVKRTVALTQIRPMPSTTMVIIPETIVFQNKTFTVTGIYADNNDMSTPIISEAYKDNNIKIFVFPKTVTGTISNLGTMNKLEKLIFFSKSTIIL
ncbi:MAG: leucine-rich repeat protein [Mobilitalea sp.]